MLSRRPHKSLRSTGSDSRTFPDIALFPFSRFRSHFDFEYLERLFGTKEPEINLQIEVNGRCLLKKVSWKITHVHTSYIRYLTVVLEGFRIDFLLEQNITKVQHKTHFLEKRKKCKKPARACYSMKEPVDSRNRWKKPAIAIFCTKPKVNRGSELCILIA